MIRVLIAVTAIGLMSLSAFAQTPEQNEVCPQRCGRNACIGGGRACVKCDLFQVDLSYKELEGRDLSGSRLRQADLSLATFRRLEAGRRQSFGFQRLRRTLRQDRFLRREPFRRHTGRIVVRRRGDDRRGPSRRQSFGLLSFHGERSYSGPAEHGLWRRSHQASPRPHYSALPGRRTQPLNCAALRAE